MRVKLREGGMHSFVGWVIRSPLKKEGKETNRRGNI